MDFECPRCGEKLSADEASVGTTTECPTCTYKFAIPAKPPSAPIATQSPQMRTKSRTIIWVAAVLAVCVGIWSVIKGSSPVAPQKAKVRTPDVDLVSATVYGRHVFELGLDELTDFMGRPSRIGSPAFDRTHGAYLVYADKGLTFSFTHPSIDSRQTCHAFEVHLESTTRVKMVARLSRFAAL